MFTREQGPGAEAVVRFRGVLDGPSALELRAALAAGPPGSVTLDLAQASAIDSYGLSVLVAELQARGGIGVKLRGLRQSHIRLLGYFGVDLTRLGIREESPASLADAVAP